MVPPFPESGITYTIGTFEPCWKTANFVRRRTLNARVVLLWDRHALREFHIRWGRYSSALRASLQADDLWAATASIWQVAAEPPTF